MCRYLVYYRRTFLVDNKSLHVQLEGNVAPRPQPVLHWSSQWWVVCPLSAIAGEIHILKLTKMNKNIVSIIGCSLYYFQWRIQDFRWVVVGVSWAPTPKKLYLCFKGCVSNKDICVKKKKKTKLKSLRYLLIFKESLAPCFVFRPGRGGGLSVTGKSYGNGILHTSVRGSSPGSLINF